MSTSRHPKYRFKGPKQCRWCGKEPKKPRITWCSDACVQEYLDRTPQGLRKKAFERDKGVCAKCGRDCEKLAEKINARIRKLLDSDDSSVRVRAVKLSGLFRRLGVPMDRFWLKRSLWDADHIKPVVEGGGETTIDNIQTLCICCHKKETKKLAKRRAEARRKKRNEPI